MRIGASESRKLWLVELSVKTNDSIGEYFKWGRVLSPLLFNLAADTLVKMIKKAQENGLIQGLVPEHIPNGVANLQYADIQFYAYKMKKIMRKT